MPGFEIWPRNSQSQTPSSIDLTPSSSSSSTLGGIFLEPTVYSSTVNFISHKCSSITISNPISFYKHTNFGGLKRGRRSRGINEVVVSGVFLTVSLRNDGLLQESKVCLVQNEDSKSLEEEDKVAEGGNIVLESKENRKVKARGGFAMNTTKHLWAGAIAAMVSRFLLLVSLFLIFLTFSFNANYGLFFFFLLTYMLNIVSSIAKSVL
jgi:hypothetical protein